MSEEKDNGISTIIAFIAVCIAIPFFLIKTVFNKDLDVTTRISYLLFSIPSLFLIFCFVCIVATMAFWVIPVYLDSDAWPIGVFIMLIAVVFIVNIAQSFKKKS